MEDRRFNWPLWAGFLLSIIAFLSYFFFFVWFPSTRDFPWANLLIFGTAAFLVLVGVRRAFAPGRPKRSKVAGVAVVTLAVSVFASFIFITFIFGRSLPTSDAAPRVGQKAPDFTLADTNGELVSLSELLASPSNENAAPSNSRGALLIFYRGSW